MLDRASIFSDPQIVEILKTKVIPVAVDAWYMNRKQDGEGEFYRKVVSQDVARTNFNSSTQGRYAFTPEGKLIGFNNNRSVERIQRLLQKAIEAVPGGGATPIDTARTAGGLDRTLPDGTVIVNVYGKVIGGQEETGNKTAQMFQASLGEDHLWIRKGEAEQLSRGELPESLKRRIALYHLNDFTRGEPNLWRADQVKKLEMGLKDGKLTGSVQLETPDGRRGYETELLGFVEAKDGKLTRFDVVSKGLFWGAGTYTNTAGTPKGKFPLAVAFRLAEGGLEADKVPPQAARDLGQYLR
ncbi:MAG: hypothetical protein HY293_18305 [Planctomycetes bacterium]|nr:hypothetical protein [Planctomycetota bacterium]